MIRSVRLLVAVALVTGCHERAKQEPDASLPDGGFDAGAPPCLDYGFGEPPPDLEGCGICMEPHARHLAPHTLGSGRGWDAAAVPGGLVVAMMADGVVASFVTEDGDVVPLAEHPYADHPGAWPYGYPVPQLAPIPGTNRVWIVTRWRRRALQPEGENWTDLVLYEYGRDGWRRIAGRGHERSMGNIVALPTGEVVGWSYRAVMGGAIYLRARATEHGSVDVLERTRDDDEGFHSALWWGVALDSGNLAMLVTRNPVEHNGSIEESWVLIVDSELRLVEPPRLLGAAYDDPAYEVDPWYGFPLNPRFYSAYRRRDGTAVVLLAGTRADSGAMKVGEFWLQRIEPDGSLRYPVPGVPVNPTDYLRRDEVETDGFQLPFAVPFGTGGDGVIWNETEYGDTDGSVRVQVIDDDGNRVFPEARDMGRNHEVGLRTWAQHGDFAGPYLGQAEFLDETGTERKYSVVRYGPDVEWAWPDRLYVQRCEPRTAEPGLMVVAAHDDGVWVLWDDRQPDVQGVWRVLAKVALVRDDGTFAWGR